MSVCGDVGVVLDETVFLLPSEGRGRGCRTHPQCTQQRILWPQVSGVPRLENLVSGLDACVSPKPVYPTPNSQSGGIWWVAFGRLVRVK